jgi:D-glycero-D-manno-heptose 1,7-bisphosphate phosphatase
MNRAIFLDRDGVINTKPKEHDYIKSVKEFRFLPQVKEAIRRLSKTDYNLIILTNQRGISRGVFSEEDLSNIHQHMLLELEKSGGRIDSIYFCPHSENTCNCRKPLPGMLDKAAKDYSLNLEKSWMIGDSNSDIECGLTRTCRTIFIGEKNNSLAKHTCLDLYDASKLILNSS